MIVDTSALIAILFDEPERHVFQRVLASTDRLGMSAGSWIELAVVLSRKRKNDMLTSAERLLEAFEIQVESVDVAQADLARGAYLEFGRGSGHPARLNFGDCFSYALAKHRREPLLFKGNDFGQTDIDIWDG